MTDARICPTCGQVTVQHRTAPLVTTQSEFLSIMREREDRHVYRVDGSNRWVFTNPGTARRVEVAPALIGELARLKVIRLAYLGVQDCYGLGPTVDVEASLELRRKTGNKKSVVYA